MDAGNFYKRRPSRRANSTGSVSLFRRLQVSQVSWILFDQFVPPFERGTI